VFSPGGGIIEGIRQYIISVTAAAILCGILTVMVGGKQIKPVWKLIVGIFLTLTAVRPLADIDLGAVPSLVEVYSIQAEEAVLEGELMMETQTQAIIKSRLEAYILDKAEVMGVSLEVNIALNENGLPISVRLSGAVPPGAKKRLQSIIETDLGIPKEAQKWSG
jgi:hypothetical protein